MRLAVLGGLLLLAGCGGGGTTGPNYSDPPPQATIVATPSPVATPSDDPGADGLTVDNSSAAEDEAATNAM